MKKLSSKIIIFLLVTILLWSGVNFGFVKNANAQDSNAPAGSISMPVDGGTPTVGNSVGQTAADQALSNVQIGGTGVLSNQAISDIGNGVMPGSSGSKSGWTIKTIIGKAADLASGIFFTGPIWVSIMAWIIPINAILAALTMIVAGVFDALLNISMSSFSSIIDSAGINTAWTIIRNVLNVSFIFILLYIAISIILGSFGPKKKSTVAGVVISALLINYSMFITRLIIDFGNIIAVALYNAPGGAFNSAALMGGLQIQTILSPDNLTSTGQISSLILMVIEMVLLCVFMSTLFKGIIFMLGRLVALLALLALSPFGFVGLGIPWLKDKADEWWTNLIGQVFLLPVFLFFLMMTSIMLKAAQDIIGVFNSDVTNFSTHVSNGSALANGNSATAFQPGQWIYFCLIIGMLHLSVKMTKKMSGGVGDVMDKAVAGMKWAAGAAIAIGASVVTGGAAAPMAAGALSSMVAKGGVPGRIGLIGQKVMSRGESASKVFRQPGLKGDIARDVVLANVLGGVKNSIGLDLKKSTDEYNKYQKDYTKRASEEANKVGPADVNAEMKNRKETMKNIEEQADGRVGQTEEGKKLLESLKKFDKNGDEMTKGIKNMKEAIESETDETKKTNLQKTLKEKEDELDKLKTDSEEAKKRRADAAKIIGEEMGYDTESHEAEMKVLETVKLEKEKALNEHLNNLSKKSYYGKKAAETLRAAKGKYKEKSPADELREFAKKQYEKEQKESKSEEPKEEKKEEKK